MRICFLILSIMICNIGFVYADSALARLSIRIENEWTVRFNPEGVSHVFYGSNGGDDAMTPVGEFSMVGIATGIESSLNDITNVRQESRPEILVSIAFEDGSYKLFVPKDDCRNVLVLLIKRVLRLSKPSDMVRFEYLLDKYPLLGIDAAAFRQIQNSKEHELTFPAVTADTDQSFKAIKQQEEAPKVTRNLEESLPTNVKIYSIIAGFILAFVIIVILIFKFKKA
jgi:hypothetical protein